MLLSLNELRGYTIQTKDNYKEKVTDFYFDDHMWILRYVIANTGPWLTGRLVLISPSAFDKPEWVRKIFPLTLTKAQIEDSPSIDADKPVSRQKEEDLFNYYGWPPYWIGTGLGAGYVGAATSAEGIAAYEKGRAAVVTEVEKGDSHLQSVKAVEGYRIHAADGEIGHLDDLIVDDETWALRYAVIDTRNWWPGKKVLVATDWIKDLQWEQASVTVPFLTHDQIKNSPAYERGTLLDRPYETRFFDYYRRPPYWR